MFVYKKGALKKEIRPLTGDTAEMELYHEPSGVRIAFKFFTDEPDENKLKSCKDGKVNMISSYEIFKWKEENKYAFKDQVWDAKETLLKNFQNAIEVFEQRIFEQLNEQPPQPTNEQAEPPEGGNTFSELPEVGDFVQQGSRFGRVVDVDQTTRMVKIEKMTRKEVMDILRAQKNEALGMSVEINQPSGMSPTMRKLRNDLLGEKKYDDGGVMSIGEDFFVVQVDEEGSNLTILRVQGPQQSAGDQQEPQGEPQDSPDNVQDPFEENQGQGDGQGDGQDGDSGDGQDGDSGDGQDGDSGDGQDGDSGDGQDGDSGDGQDGDSGDGQDGDRGEDGDKGDSGPTNPWQPTDDFGDDDFFDEDELKDVLDSVKNKLDEISKQEDEQAKNDVAAVAKFLGLTEENIKMNFLSKREALATIGGRNVFESNNDERIKNALNLIFSN